jgi:hypothetical protein
VQSSHASKRLKIESHHVVDKGKAIVVPSSPSDDSEKSMSSWIHLRDDCSHVISEIKPKGSAHPKANSGKSRGDSSNQERVASQTRKYVFLILCCLLFYDSGLQGFWTTCFILDI